MDNLLSLQEAVAVVLLNKNIRTLEITLVAEEIERRFLYFCEDAEPLVEKIGRLVSITNDEKSSMFEQQAMGFIRLKDDYALFAKEQLEWQSVFLKQFKGLFNCPGEPISVVNLELGENNKVGFYPEEVICIISNKEGKGGSKSKKTIYQKMPNQHGEIIVTRYSTHLPFNQLRVKIDPLSHYLAQISRDAFVNVSDFVVAKNKIVSPAFRSFEIPALRDLYFQKGREANAYYKQFIQIQKNYINRTSYEKTVLNPMAG